MAILEIGEVTLSPYQAANHCLLPPLKSSHGELSDVFLRPVLVLQPQLVLPAVHRVRLQDVQGRDVAVREVARLRLRRAVLPVAQTGC